MKFATLTEACEAYAAQATVLESAQADLTAAVALTEEAGKAQATAEAALKTSKEAQTKAEEQVAGLETKLTAATEKVTTLEAEVGTLKADAKTAEEQAAAICAAAGVDPLALEAGGNGAGSILEQYNAITDPAAKGEFFAKHKEAIYKEDSQKKD